MDSVNGVSLLAVGDFYGDKYVWRVVEENGLISLVPRANRKILKIRAVGILAIATLVCFLVYLLTMVYPIGGFKYYLVMSLPLAIILFGALGLFVNAYLESKDIKQGPSLIFDLKNHKIVLPRENMEFEKDASTYLQIITNTKTESQTVYEMNIVHENKRYPLLRALNPFVLERGKELGNRTDLNVKTYQSSTKSSYYQVATGGR